MSIEENLVLTIDFVARRYGVLPSTLMKSGDTFDLKCAELAEGFAQFTRKNPGVKTNHGFTQAQLQAQIDAVRNKK